MKEKLEKFELYRQQVCKKANIFLWIGIGLLVLGFVLLFSLSETIDENSDVGMVFVIPIIISIIFFSIFTRALHKNLMYDLCITLLSIYRIDHIPIFTKQVIF